MISRRLKELREEKKLLQKDIAKILNISTSAYGYYEQAKRNPDTETIKKLADFFNVSTDYLLGRTDNRNIYEKSEISSQIKNTKNSTSNKPIEDEVFQKLLLEGLILEGETVPHKVYEKVLEYGINAAIEIFKLEKKLEK